MQSLVATERTTPNSVSRSQISVMVGQGDIAGGQVDIDVDQLWDINIAEPGARLKTEFAKWDRKCGESAELQKRGATVQSAEAWANACKQALAEREKFNPVFRTVMQQRAELKSFQDAARTRRKALVGEADRIE